MKIDGISYIDGNPISIDIKGSVINQISNLEKQDTVSKSGVYIAPGLIDHQVNGYFGYSFVDQDLSLKRIKLITRKLRESGVTTYYPTLITNDRKLLLQNLSILAEAVREPDIGLSIPGFHLEGPYIPVG